jgi:hypothetical protein
MLPAGNKTSSSSGVATSPATAIVFLMALDWLKRFMSSSVSKYCSMLHL